MKATDFKHIPNFSAGEAWGDIAKVQWYHVIHLAQIRERLREYGCDWQMIIHGSYATSGHAPQSFHYKGLATDFRFHFKSRQPKYSLQFQYDTLQDILSVLNLSHFCGLGAYPDWQLPGFHLDSRGWRARWIRVRGGYVYDEKMFGDLLKGVEP